MLIVSIFVSFAAIGALCWLLFMLAVFALPFFAGLSAGMWAYGSGAGVPGAVIITFVAAGATFAVGQILLAVAKPMWLRLLVVLAFVAPAVVAGFHATRGIVTYTMPSETWQFVFSVIGAIAVGATAFVRVKAISAPDPSARGVPRT